MLIKGYNLKEETVIEVGKFTILWNWFEWSWCNNNCNSKTIKHIAIEKIEAEINQEKYLKVFLEDGNVPMDNNAAERAIKNFCIGRKNWLIIDTIRGAQSSAIIYSIAETAKAHNLKPYEYFEYLLEEIPQHMEDTDMRLIMQWFVFVVLMHLL